MLSNNQRQSENRPFTVHLCAEVDLEVLSIVEDVEEGTALVKLGDAEEKTAHSQLDINLQRVDTTSLDVPAMKHKSVSHCVWTAFEL